MDWTVFAADLLDATTPSLFDSTLVYLEYINACGTVVSDEALAIVNPLPSLPSAVGSVEPCINSSDNLIEAFPFDPGLNYHWESAASNAEITSGEMGHQILFNVDSSAAELDLAFLLTLENDSTTCLNDTVYQITTSSDVAPSLGEVIKKPGINILVCSDSSDCAQYSWGAINIATGQEELFENGDQQYIFIEDLDPESWYYFVDVWYDCGDGPGCITRMYYNYPALLGDRGNRVPSLFSLSESDAHDQLNITSSSMWTRWMGYESNGATRFGFHDEFNIPRCKYFARWPVPPYPSICHRDNFYSSLHSTTMTFRSLTPFLAFAFLLSLTACESEAERQAREAVEEQARVEAEAERLRLEEERRIIEEARRNSIMAMGCFFRPI